MRITTPQAPDEGQYLEPQAAERLLDLLQDLERQGRIPDSIRQLLADARAGALLATDGSVELGYRSSTVRAVLLSQAGTRHH